MGICRCIHLKEGYNVKDVFNELVEEKRREYGEDYYNGKISNSCLGSKKMSFDKYNKTTEKKAYTFVEKDIDNGEKNCAKYIDLGVVEYHLLTVKKKNIASEKPVYKMKFVVDVEEIYYLRNMATNVKNKPFDNKSDADKYAMEQTMKTLLPHKVTKEYVLEKGQSDLTETYIERKVYKSKPKLKDMSNKKLLELHKYLFYALASC